MPPGIATMLSSHLNTCQHTLVHNLQVGMAHNTCPGGHTFSAKGVPWASTDMQWCIVRIQGYDDKHSPSPCLLVHSTSTLNT
jgi:hypothetical protein